MSLIYAIGDIHGQRAMLRDALTLLEAKLEPGDYAVFLGDYIDRGEDSRGVIDDLMAFQEQHPETIFLRGNHDQWLLYVLEGAPADGWLANGGHDTLRSYGTFYSPYSDAWKGFLPPGHVAWLRSLALEHVAANHRFVHAGLVATENAGELENAGAPWKPDLWVREPFLSCEQDFGAIVVFGHTVQGIRDQRWRPLVMSNKVGLDTGAVFGGKLSVAAFDDAREWRTGPAFTLYQNEQRIGENE